ncbi:hypothetical protein THII_2226 [Thioploca ingrica]|uniref:Uncharacterized protein n=1 Tax=Thioploca ingrica TaxID=40754 RepID=A0A090AES6_9GAMM|nr:hypothetical protein THII_2226 [Thioploca ingrica]
MAKANHTITGNNSLTTINQLSLAIEALADVISPEQTESLPIFVVEGLFVGIQHLAQKINQLTQPGLVQGGEAS